MGRISFGPIIPLAFLIAIIVIAIVFGNIIFGNIEAETDFTNMTETQNQSYNTTTGMVQISFTGLNIVGWLLVLGCILFGIFMIARAVR